MMHTKTIAALTTVAIALGSTGVASAHAGHAPSHKGHRSHVLERHLSKGLRHKIDRKVRHGHNGTNGGAGVNGVNGKDGVNGRDGQDGLNGKNGLNGVSGYEVATFHYSGVGPGGVATVACSSESKVAVSGGYYTHASSADMSSDMAALHNGSGIVASFPGRMDWSTKTPKPNRNDGWVIRFNDKPAGDVTLYAVCINAA